MVLFNLKEIHAAFEYLKEVRWNNKIRRTRAKKMIKDYDKIN